MKTHTHRRRFGKKNTHTCLTNHGDTMQHEKTNCNRQYNNLILFNRKSKHLTVYSKWEDLKDRTLQQRVTEITRNSAYQGYVVYSNHINIYKSMSPLFSFISLITIQLINMMDKNDVSLSKIILGIFDDQQCNVPSFPILFDA